MVRANFSECGARYMSSPELISRWNYTGPTKLIPNHPQSQITYEGCMAICGTAPDWYPWSTSSNTITTWVLPIIGTLLQAPFESNAFWRTFKASCRWLGSPMASLAYILWNIKVSGKCALFVDMAIPYDGPMPDEDSDFAAMRDSFYILMNINQYKMKPLISMTKEAEGLLRIVLFSRDLKLIGTKRTLRELREKLARELRSNRRKGVIPVFISTLWFLFSLGISIQSAFGYLGDNAQAHDLAMGLFVSWFPILILCSIVDRNPVASDDIQRKLNKMIDVACESLRDHNCREDFIASFSNEPEAQKMAYWVRKIGHQAEYIKGKYFDGFAGQGRVRFHYGAAHAILIDIEKAYIADHGRNWLADEHEARMNLMLGHVDHGLVWFDGRQFWQIFAAVVIVVGTGIGAFILSYFTPTVGLGCRSGGFMVFGVVSFALLLAELLIWFYTSPVRKQQIKEIVQQQMSLAAQSGLTEKHVILPGLATTKTTLAKVLDIYEMTALNLCLVLTRLVTLTRKHRRTRLPKVEAAIREHFTKLRALTTRQWFERCFLQPVEVMNTIWLCYLIAAQTFGAFVTCACQTSVWAGGGGYMDFLERALTHAPGVKNYWIMGTIITCVVMGLGMIYVFVEWCLQAHLSTEDYTDAMHGLRNARCFRRATFWVQYPVSAAVLLVNYVMRLLGLRKSHERKTLVWTKEGRYRPSIGRAIFTLGNTMHALPFVKPTHSDGAVRRETQNEQGDQVQRPGTAITVDCGTKRGSVTATPLLGKGSGSAPRLRTSLESPLESPWCTKMV